MLIKCLDCENEFEFTDEERTWFEDKFGADFKPPKRCKPCRKKRKEERDAGGAKPRRTRSR